MVEAAFQMTVEPCAILQAEAWPGSEAALTAALSRQLGRELPVAFGEVAAAEGWLAIRVAPRRFWFVADRHLEAPWSIDPAFGCLVALGESRLCLRLAGSRTFDILAACLAIDWNAPEAQPGRAVQAGFHGVAVMAIRTGPDACDLLVPRSFARSLGEWLAGVAAPYQHRGVAAA